MHGLYPGFTCWVLVVMYLHPEEPAMLKYGADELLITVSLHPHIRHSPFSSPHNSNTICSHLNPLTAFKCLFIFLIINSQPQFVWRNYFSNYFWGLLSEDIGERQTWPRSSRDHKMLFTNCQHNNPNTPMACVNTEVESAPAGSVSPMLCPWINNELRKKVTS